MKLSILAAAMILTATGAASQHAHRPGPVAEAGQSQFAAIAEIVAVLRDDPETDWAQVDISALRDHLVDMDNVITKAVVDESTADLSVTFTATGDASVAASIKRMVLAHSPMLEQATGWTVDAEALASGAVMRVQVASADEVQQVVGLGFFGLLTVGAHHQQHHLLIATGSSPH